MTIEKFKSPLLLFFALASEAALADYLKPVYYIDQCAELAFNIADENQKIVSDEFNYFAPAIVEYENSTATIDVTIILEQERFGPNKDREFICGFNKNGQLVDYVDPFQNDQEFVFDEPFIYELQAGDYVDVENSACTAIEVSSEMINKTLSGAAIGASIGVTGGIIAIPVSGGVLVAAGSGGGAIIGGGVGGVVGVGHIVYHCLIQ